MTPVFDDHSLLVILIEKKITEINLDIDRVIRYERRSDKRVLRAF